MNEWNCLFLLYKITYYNSGRRHSLCLGINKDTRTSLSDSGGGNLYFGSSPLETSQNNCVRLQLLREDCGDGQIGLQWGPFVTAAVFCPCVVICQYRVSGVAMESILQDIMMEKVLLFLEIWNHCQRYQFAHSLPSAHLELNDRSSDRVKRGWWLLGLLPATSWYPNTSLLCWGREALFSSVF